MTDLRKLLLASAAGLALTAGPVLAEGTYDQAPEKDMQTEGAMELDTSADTDSVAQLESLGYTDVEPLEAQGDAPAEGRAYFTGTNADGEPVTILFDEQAGTVISEEPSE